MTRPRAALVSLDATPWYHLVNRCVRRAFLCGTDAVSGQSYEHRRGWISDRLHQLAGVFAIDVAAYAVMSNHYHLVVRVDVERAEGWSDDEVLKRWTALFTGPLLVQRYCAGADMLPVERKAVSELAATYRERLADVSWFMRLLNEAIARQANAEDGAKGRFWEGRFKSQALLDEAAILSAMAYVDLNPIRAGMAETPETSAYTSVAERMAELPEGDERDTGKARAASPDRPPCDSPRETPVGQGPAWCETLPCQPLMPFDATARLSHAIPFAFEEYLELVESTGRCQRPDKRGQIGERVPTLLDRLGIDPEAFIAASSTLMQRFGSAVGTPASLTARCAARQARHLRGMRAAREVFERRAA
ncbi:transposase [Salinicola sp. LHM]|jgi:REP element-mobilizing transposase RayT|uniref:transposase n=2 Tax=Salinicola TaxID=404432 RepID=UPI002ACD7846|nr:transposase [Salinicola sp. LHM]MED5296062.1 transposase [Pseudomonadota bacterium]WQH34195.1 transposase [Salinicola sp. LHM]